MDEKPFDSINVIPFVDIMLVLLAIVLTTSSFIASGRIPIHLPKAAQSVHQAQESHVIDVSADGAIHINGRSVTGAVLKTELALLAPDTPLLIRADKEVSLQRFIDVVDVLKQMNFSKVAVQTESR
jgi:biopolymer transport protein ExbD